MHASGKPNSANGVKARNDNTEQNEGNPNKMLVLLLFRCFFMSCFHCFDYVLPIKVAAATKIVSSTTQNLNVNSHTDRE